MIWARTGRLRINEALGFLLAVLVAASLLLTMARSAHASTTFVVNSTGDGADADTNDGVCDASSATGNQCTLRAAIEQANATPGVDTIHFFIPDDPAIPGFEVKTISPAQELPKITDPVTIDGYTQPGASANAATDGTTNAVLKIVLSGANANLPSPTEGVDGLVVSSGGTTIRGLAINGFKSAISGGDGGEGIFLVNVAGNTNNVIEGNFIGTDADGTASAGNQGTGIVVFGQSTGNTIGGTRPAAHNLVSGNDVHGILLSDAGNDKVQGNLIGSQKDGATALGNGGEGLLINGSSNNTVGGVDAANVIAFNGGAGVNVIRDAATGNRILNNSIFSNALFDIELDGGRPANDLKDRDTGPNTLQNVPDLASATTSGGTTTIEGTLESTPRKRFTIQFFRNPSGVDEGKAFIGEASVKTNRRGAASFTFSPAQAVPVGEAITATATNSGGNTSEFSDLESVSSS